MFYQGQQFSARLYNHVKSVNILSSGIARLIMFFHNVVNFTVVQLYIIYL